MLTTLSDHPVGFFENGTRASGEAPGPGEVDFLKLFPPKKGQLAPRFAAAWVGATPGDVVAVLGEYRFSKLGSTRYVTLKPDDSGLFGPSLKHEYTFEDGRLLLRDTAQSTTTELAQSATQDAAEETFGPTHFRDGFAACLRNGGYDDEAIRSLVYLPTTQMMAPKLYGPDAANPLARLDALFAAIEPSELHARGTRVPIQDQSDVLDAVRSHPVHIVVVPGIFGEFLDVSPFQEVFDNGGTASAWWGALLEAHRGQSSVTDEAFDAIELRDTTYSLGDLLSVGSIDDTDGTPLVTVTYLKPLRGSFEDFGTLGEDTSYYLRRLNKYFTLIGEPANLYILGYSRGTAAGLDLIASAWRAPNQNPWVKGLDGFIGLAGVIYGTQLADAGLAEGSPTSKLVAVLQQLADELEPCSETDTVSAQNATLGRNTQKWVAAVAEMALIQAMVPTQKELLYEGLAWSSPNTGSLFAYIQRLLTEEILQLGSPVEQCGNNVERFRLMVSKVVAGAETLTTAARLQWWRSNTLPAHVRYFAITGTMGDATFGLGQMWDQVKNPVGYDPESADFRSLRTNYYDLFDASGTELNDSQVPVQRGRFWPEIHAALNPRQPALDTYFMGTLGIHHWGLSFPRAVASNDGLAANPFPRTILLEAIGAFVAQVAEHGR